MSTVELETTPPEVKDYQRTKLYAHLAGAVLGLVWLAVLGLWLGPKVGEWLRELVGDRPALQLLGMAIVLGVGLEVLTAPLDFYSSYILEHRYQLSNQTLAGWMWKRIKSYLVGGVLGLVMLYGLYGIIWSAGAWWWLAAAVGFLVFSVVLGQLIPTVILPLFYKVTPLDDPDLLERIRRLADGTGLSVQGVYRLHLSEETKKANAALAGLGRARRVLLGDTLLDQFTPEEIEVVFAHETGHHVFRHLPKMVVLSVLSSVTGFWLVDRIVGIVGGQIGYHGIDDPAGLPFLLLVLTLFGLLLSPALNALSRYFETQCDRYALERTANPDAYRAAFVKLAKLNKSDPEPHPLVVWLFYDHPPIKERLAIGIR